MTGYNRLVGVHPDNALASVIHGHLGSSRETWIPSEAPHWLSSGNVRTLYWWDGTNDRAIIGVNVSTGALVLSTPAYFSRRLLSRPNVATIAVNSTTYIAQTDLTFYHDFAAFAFTHYRIVANGQANEVGETVKLQLATAAAPTVPLHTGGDDVTATNTTGDFDSGWLTLDVAQSGFKALNLATKGSTATVDFLTSWVEIHFKIA